jgi:MMPL family
LLRFSFHEDGRFEEEEDANDNDDDDNTWVDGTPAVSDGSTTITVPGVATCGKDAAGGGGGRSMWFCVAAIVVVLLVVVLLALVARGPSVMATVLVVVVVVAVWVDGTTDDCVCIQVPLVLLRLLLPESTVVAGGGVACDK